MGESRRTAPSVLVFTTRDGVPTRYYVVVTRKVTRHGCVNDHDDNENVDDNGAAQKISNGVAERPTAVFEIDVSTGEVVHDVIADRFRDETRALEELGRRHGAATGAADANSVNPLVPIARGVALCSPSPVSSAGRRRFSWRRCGELRGLSWFGCGRKAPALASGAWSLA